VNNLYINLRWKEVTEMITIYKTIENKLIHLPKIESGCYISIINPTEEELFNISSEYHIDFDDLISTLNSDEISRYLREDEYTVITIDIPVMNSKEEKVTYTTIPLSVIFTENLVFTICLEDTFIQYNLNYGKFKNIYTFMKYRFILQILYRHTCLYLEYLKIIDNKEQSAI
jgi:magnesium transporter